MLHQCTSQAIAFECCKRIKVEVTVKMKESDKIYKHGRNFTIIDTNFQEMIFSPDLYLARPFMHISCTLVALGGIGILT